MTRNPAEHTTDDAQHRTADYLQIDADGNLTLSLDEFPDEAVAYAFDQLEDRLLGVPGDEALRAILATGELERDYDGNALTVRTTVVEHVLWAALDEKIRDIKHEIARDERSDFSAEDVKQWRRDLRAIRA